MAIGVLMSSSIVNKLNIMSYNSTCIELLRSLLYTLYIHSPCARRRVELARGQRLCAVLYISKVQYPNKFKRL